MAIFRKPLKNLRVGVILSHSQDFGDFCSDLYRFYGSNIAILLPGQIAEIDILFIYTNKGFPGRRMTSLFKIGESIEGNLIFTKNQIPPNTNGDSLIEEFLYSGSIEYFLANKIPIIGIDTGAFYLAPYLEAEVHYTKKDMYPRHSEINLRNNFKCELEEFYLMPEYQLKFKDELNTPLISHYLDDTWVLGGINKEKKIGFNSLLWNQSNRINRLFEGILLGNSSIMPQYDGEDNFTFARV